MKKFFLPLIVFFAGISLLAQERVPLWPEGRMPDAQPHQIAAMTDVSEAPGFDPDSHRMPFLEWYPAPENPNGACMILISGGGYFNTCDVKYVQYWKEELTKVGVQCVNLVYRTPRPKGLPIYQSAWDDGQRAVRLVRNQAAKRGFDPERIGVVGMSAGAHLSLLLVTSSLNRAYAPVDDLDSLSCHINWAIVNAPAYATTDGEAGGPATREGYGPDVSLSSVFAFDEKTCPMSFHHGQLDPYPPTASTLVYRKLREMGVPAELHLYPNRGHAAIGFERGIEFLRQMGFLGSLEPEVLLMDRFTSNEDRERCIRQDVWPEGRIPNRQEEQCIPYIEWHFPAVKKTNSIQIVYSGGSYTGNDPDGFEVAPVRRYLNALGITVVTLKSRTPRPKGLSKHTTAWQDLQRTVRLVRSQAESFGLAPDKIGIMGSSAGGHLTLMGVTSSRHKSYLPIDNVDKLPCNVQWGIGIYPAYALTDGAEAYNTTGGNADSATLVPEFSFDLSTAPMLLLHGDADGWAAINSVKVWEKMRMRGIPAELHTLAKRDHCFQRKASPGTGSYTWMDRIADFLRDNHFLE